MATIKDKKAYELKYECVVYYSDCEEGEEKNLSETHTVTYPAPTPEEAVANLYGEWENGLEEKFFSGDIDWDREIEDINLTVVGVQDSDGRVIDMNDIEEKVDNLMGQRTIQFRTQKGSCFSSLQMDIGSEKWCNIL